MKFKKILIKEDNVFYWADKDFQNQFGVIKESEIKKIKSGKKVKTHLGKEFLVLDALFGDNIIKIKRGPAIILPKDIGIILTLTGIDKNSVVLDAGVGSGVLTSYLARFCKKVYGYERNKEFLRLAKDNLYNLDIKNVILKNADVYEKVEEKNLDLITLDLPEPWRVLENAKKSLKSSHYLVCYLPTINQVLELIIKAQKFYLENVVELICREWQTDKERLRPKSSMIAHTGFLVFLRNI